MRAARFHGRGDIRIDEVPEPATRPGTVTVEVEWAGGRCDACQQGRYHVCAPLGCLGLDHIVERGFTALVENKEENVEILVSPTL